MAFAILAVAAISLLLPTQSTDDQMVEILKHASWLGLTSDEKFTHKSYDANGLYIRETRSSINSLSSELRDHKNFRLRWEEEGEQPDFSIEKLRTLASEESNWKLQTVWKKHAPHYWSIYMFLQQETNEIVLFSVFREGNAPSEWGRTGATLTFKRIPVLQKGGPWRLEIPPNIKMVLNYPSEMEELRSNLRETEKEWKSEVERLQRNGRHQLAIGLGVGLTLLVTAIVALSLKPVNRWCKKRQQNVHPKEGFQRNRLGTEIAIDLH